MEDALKIEPERYDLSEMVVEPNKIVKLTSSSNCIVPVSFKGLRSLVNVPERGREPNSTEMMQFANTVLGQKADPYAKECGLMPVWTGGFHYEVWVAAQVRMRKAVAQADYDGYEWGWITEEGKRHKPGAESEATYDKIVGAWGRVYRKNVSHPFYHETFVNEFKKEPKDGKEDKSSWGRMEKGMLLKVNRDQTHKFAYADQMGNLNTADELQAYNRLETPNCQTPARADRRKPAQDVRVTDTPAGTTEPEPAGYFGFSDAVQMFTGITGVEGDKDQILAMFQLYAADALACPVDDVTEDKCTEAMLLKIQAALNAMEKK